MTERGEELIQVSPATTLRDCADRLQKLSHQYLRGAIDKGDLRDASEWLYAQALRYDQKGGAHKPHALDGAMEAVGRARGGLIGGQKQAKIPYTCTCGRVIRGNGGFASHRKACKHFISGEPQI
jgi:hypothetical protein